MSIYKTAIDKDQQTQSIENLMASSLYQGESKSVGNRVKSTIINVPSIGALSAGIFAAVGATIGGGIGILFGGIGAAPGAEIGAQIGTAVGVLSGTIVGLSKGIDDDTNDTVSFSIKSDIIPDIIAMQLAMIWGLLNLGYGSSRKLSEKEIEDIKKKILNSGKLPDDVYWGSISKQEIINHSMAVLSYLEES